ncbi:MAG TPA: hypothetical protein VMM37_04200 [Bacteroidota bacterium]|nr:hypothetical protein [Bacteroidota bacterium]
MTLFNRTSIDSVLFVAVDSGSVQGTRLGHPVRYSLDSIVYLRRAGEPNAFRYGIVSGLGGILLGEAVYQGRRGYAADRNDPDLGFRLQYYGGGFLLGLGVGSLVSLATTPDEIYILPNLTNERRTALISERMPATEAASVPVSIAARGEAKNAIYFEAFGHGLLYSVNYERFVERKLAIRVGFSTYTVGQADGGNRQIFVPVMANFLPGEGAHRLEIGVGVEYFHESMSESLDHTLFIIGSLGYRYQPPDGGIQFRIVATPFLFPARVFSWFGTSIGVCF